MTVSEITQAIWFPYALFLAGLLVGLILTWLVTAGKAHRTQLAQQQEKEILEDEFEAAKTRFENEKLTLVASESDLKARLEALKQSSLEKEVLLKEGRESLGESFKALSSDALRANQEQFLQLAKTALQQEQSKATGDLEKRHSAIQQMVKPVSDSLFEVQKRIHELETAREGAYQGLKAQVQQLAGGQQLLHKETSQLVKALRQPIGRGQWGELQLKRCVEMAGMQEHCDFVTQATTTSPEGNKLRPDLLVNLPGGQSIVIDAKTPMSAYLDSLETEDDDARIGFLSQHAKQVEAHIKNLSTKAYHAQFETSPEFVVLFLPSESFFSAALSQDNTLIEKGVDQGVILATPTTLIALLRAVSYGWRQESLAENAREIASVGKELHRRLTVLSDHLASLGSSLQSSVNHFNKTVGSYEGNVLTQARRFEELGAASELENKKKEPQAIELQTRTPQKQETPESDSGSIADQLLASLADEKEPQEAPKLPQGPTGSPADDLRRAFLEVKDPS